MIWLLNSPRYVQRSLAIGMLLIGILLLGSITASIQSSLAKTRAEVVEKRVLLGRLVESQARYSTIVKSEPDEAGYATTFLTGQSETVIRANMQAEFMAKAAQNAVDVVSVGNAPEMTRNDVGYLGLQANITGKTANLRDFLISLEATTPILLIPQLTIRSVGATSLRQQSIEQPLIAQLRIYAALDPSHRSIDTAGDPK